MVVEMDKIVELSENIEHYMRATTTKERKVEPAEVNKVKLMMELCKLRNAENMWVLRLQE